MTLEEAHEIVHIWSAYVEYCHDRLRALFIASIPRSLLPYELEKIEEALNIVSKHYYEKGDLDSYELVHASFEWLALYAEDEKALEGAAFKFNSSDLRGTIISNMKKVQKSWIKSQH